MRRTKKNFHNISLLALLLFFGEGRAALAEDAFCYIPGAGGGHPEGFVAAALPGVLAQRGINFHYIDNGNRGSVQRRAELFLRGLETLHIQHPDLKCHFLGYSQGGVAMRYALTHYELPRQMALSLTTLSSPHTGTPLAKYPAYYGIDRGVEELTEEVMKLRFNNPESAFFSPALKEIPNYSYRTYLSDEDATSSAIEQLGFQILLQEGSERSDGIVPTASQEWGEVLSTIEMPHSFFGDGGISNSSISAVDVYEMHWLFLNHQISKDAEVPERFKTDTAIRLWKTLQKKTID